MVIVVPDDGDVVGHFQTSAIIGEHLLVRTKYLRNFRRVGVHMVGQHGALIGEDLLEHLDSFRLCLWSYDWTVMDAAHAQRMNVFVLSVLRHAIIPIPA